MRLPKHSLFLAFLLTTALQAQPQIGGGVCTNSTLSGVYYYLLSGDLISVGQVYPYVELGKLVADGQGGVTGNSHASIGGSISSYSLAGSYTVQPSCTGSMALSVNSQPSESITFQVVNGGQGAIVAFSDPTGVVAGQAYRQTASASPIQCSAASMSGSYGYLLTGVAFQSGTGYYYSQAGSATGDGRGNLSATGVANASGNTITTTGQGPYSIAGDCSGVASVKNQDGTASYYIASAEDGRVILFMASDPGYVVGGVAQPLFVTPQNAVVNAASFDPHALSPGAIFSIFGRNLPQSSSTQVLVSGEPAPVLFSNSSQINAQMPYDAPTDRFVTLSIASSETSSNAVLLNIRQAAPGIFTYSGNHAVAQNPDNSLNSPSSPAHVGDIVTAYLTGPGAVNPAVATGSAAPSSPLSTVGAPYSFTIGGTQAAVSYFGLTPGFVGLYQANIKVPAIDPGDYPVVSTVAGAASNGPVISIR